LIFVEHAPLNFKNDIGLHYRGRSHKCGGQDSGV